MHGWKPVASNSMPLSYRCKSCTRNTTLSSKKTINCVFWIAPPYVSSCLSWTMRMKNLISTKRPTQQNHYNAYLKFFTDGSLAFETRQSLQISQMLQIPFAKMIRMISASSMSSSMFNTRPVAINKDRGSSPTLISSINMWTWTK